MRHADARPWTPIENETLRARYVSDGPANLAASLGRSWSSITKRAARLGIHRRARWTAAEDATLRMLWGDVGVRAVARRLKRTPLTVYWRAQKLGLSLGVPRGLEYVSHAAARTGFPLASLWMILRWAGVSAPVAMSRPAKRPRHTHVVDPFDVDDAIAKWLATETLAAGAERVGVAAETLERWLRASGLAVPEKPLGKRRWRIPTETIDAAVATRSGKETLRAAATRLGVHNGTLRYWALRAGLPRPAGRLWLVDRVAVERLVLERRVA